MTDAEAFEEPVAQDRCPACLAAVDADQQYCLQCGERLAPTGPPASSPLGAGRTRPPAAAIVAGGAVLLLAGGFGIAYGFTRDDAKKAAGTVTVRTGSTTGVLLPPTLSVDTGLSVPTFTDTLPAGTTFPPPTDTGGIPTGSTPTFPGTGTGTGTTDQPGTGTTDPGGTGTDTTAETSDWPSGRDGFAVLLSSDDTERYTFASITAKKTRATSAGFSNAGVLNSDDYFTLNPGYWVLFLGPYSSKASALSSQVKARANGYPDAYVRRVAE